VWVDEFVVNHCRILQNIFLMPFFNSYCENKQVFENSLNLNFLINSLVNNCISQLLKMLMLMASITGCETLINLILEKVHISFAIYCRMLLSYLYIFLLNSTVKLTSSN